MSGPTPLTAAPPATLADSYPPSSTFTLQNGDVVALPVLQKNFDYVALVGTADGKKVQAYLDKKREGLTAILDANGNASVQLFTITYRAGDAGAYNEMFEFIPVKQSNIAGKPAAADAQEQGPLYYVRRVSVTEATPVANAHDANGNSLSADAQKSLPLRWGREEWGYPKSYGKIAFDEGPHDISFSYQNDGDAQAFSGKLAGGMDLPTQHVPANPYVLVTPASNIRRSYAQTISSGDFTGRAYDKTLGDSFSPNVNSHLGAELKDFGFEAASWIVCRSGQAAGLK